MFRGEGQATKEARPSAGDVEAAAVQHREQLSCFWPLGLRADYEFLAGEGFLMEQVLRVRGGGG